MISLLHPSRGRPEKSFNNSKEWIDKSGCEVELIVSLDHSDDYNSYLKKYYNDWGIEPPIPRRNILIEDNTSVVEATNLAAKEAKGDILVYLSDDFKCPDNWGLSVMKEFDGEDRPLLLKVHDDLQKFETRVCTIPIMNRMLYQKLNYFWHPEYKSMWVDCDLLETCDRIGAIKYAPHLVFPHHHYSNGKCPVDDTYKASEANWNQGLTIFNRRKLEGFPI